LKPRARSIIQRIRWPSFDAKRTKERGGDASILDYNYVNFSCPCDTTPFDHLTEMGAQATRPFPIKRISEELKSIRFPRGVVFFGELGEAVQQILDNYPNLRWWFEADGFVVAEAESPLDRLLPFDRLAGRLYIQNTSDGGLTRDALKMIASELDSQGFGLKESLQAAQWKPISVFNQKHPRAPIRSFSDAIRRPEFARAVRRRLYVARNRYKRIAND
jgi:hypothetical protein